MAVTNFSAQGSIPVRRLKTGDLVRITMDSNGIPLWQGYDPDNGNITPDWSDRSDWASTVSDSQPMQTPRLVAASGKTVEIDDGQWYWNGVLIQFGNAELSIHGETYLASTNFTYVKNNVTYPLFALKKGGSMALRVIGNLASATNTWNDTLTFKCKGVMSGVSYDQEMEVPVTIVKAGANSYSAVVTVPTQVLDSTTTSITAVAQLMLGVSAVTDYYTRWYAEGTLLTPTVHCDSSGKASKVITRSNLSGTAEITVLFFLTNPDSTQAEPVARTSVKMTDMSDEYDVVCYVDGNSEGDDGKNVVVKARVVRMSDLSVYDISQKSPQWKMEVLNTQAVDSVTQAMVVLATSSTNQITVTTDHTDCPVSGGTDAQKAGRTPGMTYDVLVTADVEWTE